MIVNAAQMPTYSQAKQALISNGIMQQGFPLHAVSSLIAALVTTAVSLPVDIVKTRYQNMKIVNGKGEYNGIFVSIFSLISSEGARSFKCTKS
jgi:solute carrier family 25 oxoglutarate transporter 11